jgi:CDP-diacylglycerol--serine O-phosphatidyltransferase
MKRKQDNNIQIKKTGFIGVYDYTVILTYFNLISAIVGMLCAIEGKFGAAVLCVALSGLFDAFDGAVARTKKNRTDDERNFGIQLDSICDVVSFGAAPAIICYKMGVNGIVGCILVGAYVLCALIRLAFFNVLEIKRQNAEGGGMASGYRGLPVTSICFIFPVVYLTSFLISGDAFVIVLHCMLALVAFLFILDFKMKKLNFDKLIAPKKKAEPTPEKEEEKVLEEVNK